MARSIFRSFTKKLFLFITVIVAIVFLVACLAAYLNPAKWWIIGFLSLGVPYLVIALVFIFIFWLIVRAKYSLIPLLALIIGYNQIRVLFGTNFQGGFKPTKEAAHFRIVSWNVGNFMGVSESAEKKKHIREEAADAILKLDADIVCLQEFNHSEVRKETADNIGLFTKKYPYYYFSKDVNKKNGDYQYGSIIFSKTPFSDTGLIRFKSGTPGSLVYANVAAGADTIRVFTTHLQSFRFNDNDYKDMEKIQDQDEEVLNASKNIIRKMKYAFTKRGLQAEIVRKAVTNSPHMQILCGDFNDVPNSFTYFHTKGDFKDAFLEKGFGIGRTFIALAPTLRIDYILTNAAFNIHQFEMIDEDLSDHVLLVSDVSLKK
jgi:endonuclease/exonuclease/phosphatase family metal-dependent hydrolase